MTNRGTATREFRRELRHAVEVAAEALALAIGRQGAADVTSKGERDIVTATDIAVEDAVRDLLARALGIAVVGEERGGVAPADGSPYWLVDPICGTRNFASGIPLYCVNLVLVEGGEVVVAAVGDPTTGAVACAERGRGAWVVANGGFRPLTAGDESGTIVIEDGKSTGNQREHAARFFAAAVRADRWDVRALGTTPPLLYLASGRVSACVEFEVPALHVAAGSLLVGEAGGRCTDLDGRPWSVRSTSLLAAATLELHAELLRLVWATAAGS
jgi:fructose-1,6-bisphosphatase/inositol monophosphatase family enzyme